MKLSLIFALLLGFAISLQATNTFELSPGATNVTIGEIVSLDVNLSATDPVFGYQFDLLYPNFLNFLSATEEGDFAVNGIGGGSPFYDTPDDSVGIVTNVLDALTGSIPFHSPGTVVNFQFTVVAYGTGNFGMQNMVLTDDSADSWTVDPVTPVSITSSAVPEPATGGLVILGIALLYWRFRVRRPLSSQLALFPHDR